MAQAVGQVHQGLSKVNTCSSCKWWGAEEFRGKRPCTHHLLNLRRKYAEDDDNGIIEIGIGAGFLELCTGPNFGCIHHEAK
jgi:hypothetical protein